MHDESDYLRRAEQFEALAEKSLREELTPLYRQLAAEYRNLAAAIEDISRVHPHPEIRDIP